MNPAIRLRRLCLIVICLVLGNGACRMIRAQSSVDNQLWTDLTLTHYFNDKWRYSGDVGFRTSISNSDWKQAYVRPTFVFLVSPSVDFRAGFSLFQSWNVPTENQLELRWHQEINLKWPRLSGFIFNHMLRAEERLFFYEVSESDFSARLRYRPTIETPDFMRIGDRKRVYVALGVDFFLPLGRASSELFVNNYRLLAGFGYRLRDTNKFELVYFRQRSRAFTEDGFKVSENVLRVRFFMTLTKREVSD